MKVRYGFVTNSSSSSFIIALKDIKIPDEVAEKYPYMKIFPGLVDIMLRSEGGYDTEKGEIITNKEEFREFLLELHDYDEKDFDEMVENEFDQNFYQKEMEYLENGYKLLYKGVDYSDQYFNTMVYNLAENFPENVIILQDD